MNSKLIDPRTLKVKNTFIEINFDEVSRFDDLSGVDDPFGMDEPVGFCTIRREMSEPKNFCPSACVFAKGVNTEDTLPGPSSFLQQSDTDDVSVDGGDLPVTDSEFDSTEAEKGSRYGFSDKDTEQNQAVQASFMAGYAGMPNMPWQYQAAGMMAPLAMWPTPPVGFPLAQYSTVPGTESASVDDSWTNISTVMMRNLPNKVTQEQLLAEVNGAGFLYTYDFLYLPIDPDTHANRGYAFLNFVSPGMAWIFKTHFEGEQFRSFHSNKLVSVVPATLQGFEANFAHYSSAHVQCRDPAARPIFLRQPAAPPWSQQNESLIVMAPKEQRKGSNPRQQLVKQQKLTQIIGADCTVAAPAPAAPAGMPADEHKFCYNCGGGIKSSYKFCKNCGAAT